MADFTLNIEELDLQVPEVIGLVSSAKFYKLAWKLQQLRIFDVVQAGDVGNEVTGGEHAQYMLHHLDDNYSCALIKNKGSLGYYYKRYKDVDYLLVTIAEEISLDNNILTAIKGMDCISLCLNLDTPQAPEDLNFIQLL